MSRELSEKNNISRRDAREQAFILLFEMSFSDEDLSIDQIKENALESREVEFSDYAVKVALGVSEHREEIDSLIESKLKKGWKLNRISRISLVVLRLAVYEMLYEPKVPGGVSINEGVELSKKYSVDESAFVNGVLGAVLKELESK